MKKLFRNRFIIAIITIATLTTTLIIVNTVQINLKKNTVDEELEEKIDNGGLITNGVYALPKSPTELQKSLYNQLTSEIDGYTYDEDNLQFDKEEAIAIDVVSNFIADFYTWTNKSSNYDVGGLTYISSTSFLIMQEHARNTFYSQLDGYIDQLGRENLLEVSSIDVFGSGYANDFYFDGVNYPAYYVGATWKYKETDALDLDSFQRGAEFKVINIDGNWMIAQTWALTVEEAN